MTRWIRLYDPQRIPPHWTDLVQPGQFAVFITEAESAAPRDPEGQPFRDAAQYAALCDTQNEAETFANATVASHPELRCEIYDHEGKTKPPVETIFHPAVRHKHTGRRHAHRHMLTGAALLTAGTILAIIDFRHDLTWLWGYIIGLKCLICGTVFLTRGYVEWREFRTEPG